MEFGGSEHWQYGHGPDLDCSCVYISTDGRLQTRVRIRVFRSGQIVIDRPFVHIGDLHSLELFNTMWVTRLGTCLLLTCPC